MGEEGSTSGKCNVKVIFFLTVVFPVSQLFLSLIAATCRRSGIDCSGPSLRHVSFSRVLVMRCSLTFTKYVLDK